MTFGPFNLIPILASPHYTEIQLAVSQLSVVGLSLSAPRAGHQPVAYRLHWFALLSEEGFVLTQT